MLIFLNPEQKGRDEEEVTVFVCRFLCIPVVSRVSVFQVAGIISAVIVMVAIVALGKLLEPLQKVKPYFSVLQFLLTRLSSGKER